MQTVEKVQKKFIIKFSETTLQIICNDRNNPGEVQIWSQIKVESIFTGYRIQSNANNEITMILSAEALVAVLKSAAASADSARLAAATDPNVNSVVDESDEIIMKLAKKDGQAVLAFEISGTTRLGKKVRVGHDVKVEVMKAGDVEKLAEPMCPEPDTHIILPSLPKLRPIIERLRSLSEILTVRANNSGILQVGFQTEAVKVDTEWKGCVNPKMSQDADPDDALNQPKSQSQSQSSQSDPDQKLYSVPVSLKSFLKFLNSHTVSTTTIACICRNYCLILYVYIGDSDSDLSGAGGVLTFYLPKVGDD